MSLQMSGVEIEKVVVNGVETESVWLNGIQIIVPPIEVGNQSENGAVLKGQRIYSGGSGNQIGARISSGFDDYIGFVGGVVNYNSSQYDTTPKVEITGDIRRVLSPRARKTRSSTDVNCSTVALLGSPWLWGKIDPDISRSSVRNVYFSLSIVGVNNATYFDCISPQIQYDSTDLEVKEGDLVIEFCDYHKTYILGSAEVVWRMHLTPKNKDRYEPNLFEVVKSGTLSQTNWGAIVVVGKR